ncbi:MAG: hypothetical protein ACM3H8_07740 [Sphingobacteriales bacterium]
MTAKDNAMETVSENDVSLARKISFLKQPGAYSHPVKKVETKETHMSWIFLVNDVVYKFKKPVMYRFLDFRTLEARLKNCMEEIRLNKRLAGDIYLGVVPLVLNEEGGLQIEGKGQVVEWLVKMKRIPEENLLDYAIGLQKTDEALIEGVAELLAKFYKNAPPASTEPELYRRKLKDEIIATGMELQDPLYHFRVELIEHITNNLVNFLSIYSFLFDDRINSGKIIEAHGDLKPEHICLAPQPAVIDALEFNRDLRIMDIAEELSFLDMECEIMGDSMTGKIFVDVYQKLSGDKIPEMLLLFYKAKKSFLRTYLVARHISEASYKKEQKWMMMANSYLLLSEKYSRMLPGKI